jgi:hypothetical protein
MKPYGVVLMVGFAAALGAPLACAQGLGSGCDNCGTVQSIVPVDLDQQWTPLGTVVPGTMAAGGPGNDPAQISTQYKIGKDLSNQGMVLLGAQGGAMYARRPETVRDRRWQVTVKMDQGLVRQLAQSYEPSLHEGDRVHVYGTQLELIQP